MLKSQVKQCSIHRFWTNVSSTWTWAKAVYNFLLVGAPGLLAGKGASARPPWLLEEPSPLAGVQLFSDMVLPWRLSRVHWDGNGPDFSRLNSEFFKYVLHFLKVGRIVTFLHYIFRKRFPGH